MAHGIETCVTCLLDRDAIVWLKDDGSCAMCNGEDASAYMTDQEREYAATVDLSKPLPVAKSGESFVDFVKRSGGVDAVAKIRDRNASSRRVDPGQTIYDVLATRDAAREALTKMNDATTTIRNKFELELQRARGNRASDPLTVECPACHAPKGDPCRGYTTLRPVVPHPSRAALAKGDTVFTKGQKVGMTTAGHYVPITDHRKAIGVVANQPTVDGIATIDIYRGAEHLAGGPVVNTKPSSNISPTEGNALAIDLPDGIKQPLRRETPMMIRALTVVAGPIVDMTSGRVVVAKDIRATVLRVELVNDRYTKVFDHVHLKLRRWSDDAIVTADIKPTDSLRVDDHPEES